MTESSPLLCYYTSEWNAVLLAQTTIQWKNILLVGCMYFIYSGNRCSIVTLCHLTGLRVSEMFFQHSMNLYYERKGYYSAMYLHKLLCDSLLTNQIALSFNINILSGYIFVVRTTKTSEFLTDKKHSFAQDCFYFQGIFSYINERDTSTPDCKHKHMLEN